VDTGRTEQTLALPRPSLVVLCGPAAAGKSSFAAEVVRTNGLASTAVVSSDACRLLLCDDTGSVAPAEWPVLQPNTFDLFVTIVGMRLAIGRPTVADGVNLHMELRPRLLEQARRHRRPTALIVFDVALETCLARNARRARRMPEEQIRAQRRALDEQLAHLADEGWDHVVRLDDRRRGARLAFANGPS
jgi:protein phosphatase